MANLITIPNNVLQGDLISAGVNTTRLVVNSTIGILGIIDMADLLGFPEYVKEDYGQTLGKWGLGHGCYLVLPVLGPSTVRDTAGMFVNVMGGDPYYNISVNGNNEFLDGQLYATTKILSGIDFRAKNIEAIDNLEKNSVDFYASVRSLYLQDRENKIKNTQRGRIEVIYKEEEDWATYAPDSSYIVFAKDHNLFLMEVGDKDSIEIQLSKDGERWFSYQRKHLLIMDKVFL